MPHGGSSVIVRDYFFVPGAAVRADGSPSGTLQRRVQGAWNAWLSHADALFLVSGAQGRYGPPEAEVMSELLHGLGVPADHIILETEGRNTLSSVINSCRILSVRGDARCVHVCTSNYHQARCRLLLSIMGFETSAVPISPERAALGWRKYLYYWLRDLVALPWDAAHLFWLRNRKQAT